jgi:hypothetical protein
VRIVRACRRQAPDVVGVSPTERWPVGGYKQSDKHVPLMPDRGSAKAVATVATMGRVLL